MSNGVELKSERRGPEKSLRDQHGDSGSARESSEEAFGKVLQLVRTVQTGMQNIDDRHGLSGAQLWALWQVSARPGLRVSELARALQIKPSTASNLLDKIETRQLVRRERHDNDNRVVSLYLTEAGHELVKDIPGPTQGRLRRALGEMAAPVLAGLVQGMMSLQDLMEQSVPRGTARPKT